SKHGAKRHESPPRANQAVAPGSDRAAGTRVPPAVTALALAAQPRLRRGHPLVQAAGHLGLGLSHARLFLPTAQRACGLAAPRRALGRHARTVRGTYAG